MKRSALKRIIDNIAGLISRKPTRYSNKKSSLYSHTNPRMQASRSGRRPQFGSRINKKLIYIAAGAVAVIAAAVVLIVILINPNAAATGADNSMKFTLTVPVYAPLSITQGMSAFVVKGIQQRLMDLGYAEEDAPDGTYGEFTVEAMQLFQAQSGLTADGVINQTTYDTLFSPSAQEYTLSLGAQGPDVEALQQRLCELGYLPEATGTFDAATEEAVSKFEKLNNLPEDGKAGMAARELLYSEDAAPNSYSYGEESPEILSYQQRLKDLGYMTSEPDGKFGPDTRAAVKLFQENAGLIADGYIGPMTKEALMSDSAQISALSLGDRGEQVTRIQERLKSLKYISHVTGYFGSETDTAVRSFQYTNGLYADGKVGPNTMDVLFSENARKSTGANITGANANSLIELALSKRGCRYVRGAKGPNTFDCSGFVYWCLNKIGVHQGYMTSGTWARSTKYTKITSMSDLKKGDIIVYNGHVAICAGGGYQVDASSGNRQVVKRKYTGSSYWRENFICGFRIF